MKTITIRTLEVGLLVGLFSLIAISSPSLVSAQMMVQNQISNTTDWEAIVTHTEEEEIEGKEVFDALTSGAKQCEDLTTEDYEVLGEYFMGEMTGESHASMNAMLIRMHGEEGEEAIHAALGKRFSGCGGDEVDDALLTGYPMMGIGGMYGGMGIYHSAPGYGFEKQGGFGFMHRSSFGYGLGSLNNILVTILLFIGILVGIKWLRAPKTPTITKDID